MIATNTRLFFLALATVVLFGGCGGGGGSGPTTPHPAPGPTIDTIPPSTSLTGVPPSATNETTAEFLFASNEAGSTFECQLDSGAIASCTSPRIPNLTLVKESTRFACVPPITAGNIDATWATFTWRVDLTAPTLRLVSRPLRDNPIQSSHVSFCGVGRRRIF